MFGGVGLGTFPLAGPFSQVSDESAWQILDAYFDAGGIYVDTAPTYGFGEVEQLLGRYLSGKPRDSFAVSTSCGWVRDGEAYRVSGKRDDVLRDAEESLDRLGLDRFDIYISHIPDPLTPLEETAAALQSLKDGGVASRIGVSNVTAAQLKRYASAAEISVVQNRLSFANRTLTAELQAELQAADAELVAYQVIERGLLSVAARDGRREGDLRNRKPEFEEGRVAWIWEQFVSPLRALADAEGVSVPWLVVGWARAQSRVALAQVGATNPAQASLIPSLGGGISSESLALMETIYGRAEETLAGSPTPTVAGFLGLVDYDVRTGSATGR